MRTRLPRLHRLRTETTKPFELLWGLLVGAVAGPLILIAAPVFLGVVFWLPAGPGEMEAAFNRGFDAASGSLVTMLIAAGVFLTCLVVGAYKSKWRPCALVFPSLKGTLVEDVDPILRRMREQAQSAELAGDETVQVLVAESVMQRNAVVETGRIIRKENLSAVTLREQENAIVDAVKAVAAASEVVDELYREALERSQAEAALRISTRDSLPLRTSRLQEATLEARTRLLDQRIARRELEEGTH